VIQHAPRDNDIEIDSLPRLRDALNLGP